MSLTLCHHHIDFFLYLMKDLSKIFPADHLAVDLKTLPDVHQMR